MRKNHSRAHSVVSAALDSPRLSLNDLARGIGASRAALEKYRLAPSPSRQVPAMPASLRLRLAVFLEEHAGKLQQLAEGLREVERNGNGRPDL